MTASVESSDFLTPNIKALQQDIPPEAVGREHARLAPSSADRWLFCPWSAQWGLEDKPNAASDRGDKLHKEAADTLYLGKSVDSDSEIAAFVNHVRNVSQYGHTLYIEQPIYSNIQDFWGTLDALIVGHDHLHIVDLKTGKWPVSPKLNPQLYCYSILALEKFAKPRVQVSIVQHNRIKRDVYSLPRLLEFRREVQSVSRSLHREANYEYCRFCPLQKDCPSYHELRGNTRELIQLD